MHHYFAHLKLLIQSEAVECGVADIDQYSIQSVYISILVSGYSQLARDGQVGSRHHLSVHT